MYIENIIKENIIQFAKENKININDKKLNLFMKKKHEDRTLALNVDNYISVCEYLHLHDIIILSTLCKEYINCYYKEIWSMIQKRHFPNSIIPMNSYLEIRDNMAIECWFYDNRIIDCSIVCAYNYINNIEIKIKKLSDELKKSHIRNINYKCKTITNMNEIKSLKRERESYLKYTPEYHINIINKYKFISEKDYTNEYYYTIKPELDMRLFGLDPDNETNKKEWVECIGWITGKYTIKREYDFYEGDDLNEDIYMYDYDTDNNLYRVRIIPDRIRDIIIKI